MDEDNNAVTPEEQTPEGAAPEMAPEGGAPEMAPEGGAPEMAPEGEAAPAEGDQPAV